MLLAIPLPVLNISFIIIIIIAFVLLLVERDFPYLFAIILLCELSFTEVIIDGLND